MLLTITNFSGIAPRLKPIALSLNQAQVAQNCRFRGGALEPIRDVEPVSPSVSVASGTRTIFKFGEGSAGDESKYWLQWIGDTSVSRGFIPKSNDTEERVYFVESGKNPKMTTFTAATSSAPYPTTAYDLGVPAPDIAPVVGLDKDSPSGAADVVSCQYIFTYVSGGVEGVPSPSVTVSTLPQDEKPVSLTFVSAPGGVDYRRLYRKTPAMSNFKKVGADILASQIAFKDDIADASLGADLDITTGTDSQVIAVPILPAPVLSYSGVVPAETAWVAYSYYKPAWSWDEVTTEWDDAQENYVSVTITHNEAEAETALSESSVIAVSTTETVTIDFTDTPPTDATQRIVYRKDGDVWKKVGAYAKATNQVQLVYPFATTTQYPSTRTYTAAGFTTPTKKPTLSSSAGTVTGTQEYMLTATVGVEGIMSQSSSISKIGGVPIVIDVPTVSADLGVTARKLYRKVSGSWKLLNSFGSGQTSYSDNLTDASLSGASVYGVIASGPAAVVRPTAPPGAIPSTDTGTLEDRYYVYTFVTDLGEEGPASPTNTTPISVSYGQIVGVTMPPPPGGNSRLAAAGAVKRIYRTATGNGGTNFFYVGEVAAAESYFKDAVATTALGSPISSLSFQSPPQGLRGLIGLPNGFFAGFDGNEIWFSEPYRPHAWPLEYNVTCDYPVVAIGVTGQSLLVFTERFPYIATGSSPAQMSLQKIDLEQGCVSARSVCPFMDGVVYASPDGLCMIGSGGAKVLTQEIHSRETWQAMNPASIELYQHDNRLYGFHTVNGVAKGFIFSPADETPAFVTTDIAATAGYNDTRLDRLFLCVGTSLVKAEEGRNANGTDKFKTYQWKSKKILLSSTTGFVFGQVIGQDFTPNGGTFGVTFKLYADGELILTHNPTDSRPFYLPPFLADEIEIELVGTAPVFAVHLAHSMLELNSVA